MEEHSYRKARYGWERITVQTPAPRRARETLRSDAPSPAQEVLQKADAELADAEETVEVESASARPTIICF